MGRGLRVRGGAVAGAKHWEGGPGVVLSQAGPRQCAVLGVGVGHTVAFAASDL